MCFDDSLQTCDQLADLRLGKTPQNPRSDLSTRGLAARNARSPAAVSE